MSINIQDPVSNEITTVVPHRSVVQPAEKRTRKRAGKKIARKAAVNLEGHGFYASTFTPEELQTLSQPDVRAEQELLRSKALRLARLTPLKKVSTQELQALARLLATVARIDALERTLLLARGKPGEADDKLLEALANMDPYDL